MGEAALERVVVAVAELVEAAVVVAVAAGVAVGIRVGLGEVAGGGAGDGAGGAVGVVGVAGDLLALAVDEADDGALVVGEVVQAPTAGARADQAAPGVRVNVVVAALVVW